MNGPSDIDIRPLVELEDFDFGGDIPAEQKAQWQRFDQAGLVSRDALWTASVMTILAVLSFTVRGSRESMSAV